MHLRGVDSAPATLYRSCTRSSVETRANGDVSFCGLEVSVNYVVSSARLFLRPCVVVSRWWWRRSRMTIRICYGCGRTPCACSLSNRSVALDKVGYPFVCLRNPQGRDFELLHPPRGIGLMHHFPKHIIPRLVWVERVHRLIPGHACIFNVLLLRNAA